MIDGVMLYDEWVEKYKPIENTIKEDAMFDKYGFETFSPEIDIVKQHQIQNIWTVVDGDSGEFWITPGFRFVNRFAYMITAIPWEGDVDDVFLGDEEDYQRFLKRQEFDGDDEEFEEWERKIKEE
jgi:hypothetical protein